MINFQEIFHKCVFLKSVRKLAGVNAHMAAVVVAILRVVGGLVAIVLIKKLPRQSLTVYDTNIVIFIVACCHCSDQKVAQVFTTVYMPLPLLLSLLNVAIVLIKTLPG